MNRKRRNMDIIKYKKVMVFFLFDCLATQMSFNNIGTGYSRIHTGGIF